MESRNAKDSEASERAELDAIENINLTQENIFIDRVEEPNNRAQFQILCKCETLKSYRCTLLPSGLIAKIMTRVLICVVIWTILWSVLKYQALPRGNVFGLYTVILLASLFGFLVRIFPLLKIPPLLGMLIAGFLLRNLPKPLDFARYIDPSWSSFLRSVALVVILLRSGLELDPGALRRLKFTVLRLAFGPCIVESVTVALMARWLLDMPWLWAFQLGFVMGAVSPAVVVPQLLILQEQGFGVQQGIPTLVMAASSCDDVLAISLFGVFLGVAFSQGLPKVRSSLHLLLFSICNMVAIAMLFTMIDYETHDGNLVFNIFRGPLELIVGLVFGTFIGVVCWFFPNKDEKDASRNRFVLLFGSGLLSMFGSNAIEFSGAGALGVLTMATVAAHGWGKVSKEPVCCAMGIVWEFFQPLLFGLIGAEVSIEYIQDGKLVGRCVGVLITSLGVRVLTTYVVALGNNLSVKEKLFIAIAWLPKATVQAAIGSMSLDIARSRGYTGKFQEDLGIQILTTAVLSIIMTAPVGAVLISLLGPRLLRRDVATDVDKKDNMEMTSFVACDTENESS